MESIELRSMSSHRKPRKIRSFDDKNKKKLHIQIRHHSCENIMDGKNISKYVSRNFSEQIMNYLNSLRKKHDIAIQNETLELCQQHGLPLLCLTQVLNGHNYDYGNVLLDLDFILELLKTCHPKRKCIVNRNILSKKFITPYKNNFCVHEINIERMRIIEEFNFL